MAERSNATSKRNQAAADVSTLQKRGRRRLVGAIALVLLAVIILPMVFDPEPKPSAPAVSIRIPSEEGTPFTPKMPPKPAAKAEEPKAEKAAEAPSPPAVAKVEPAPAAEPAKAEPAKAEPAKAEPAKAEPRATAPVEKPLARPDAKPAEKPAPPPRVAEKKPAPAPAVSGERFVVQVGAFASPDKVKEVTDQLKGARLVHYTESVATAKGPVTRVRLGPFASRAAADKAQERAKALGLNPANPIAK